MSQYLILIQTAPTYNPVIDPFSLWTGDYKHPEHQRIPVIVYALTTSNHPPTGLALLQNHCPVKLQVIHIVHAGNATDNLVRTLQIKFRHRLLHSFWYAFSQEDLEFIKSLNERNFNSIIGFIQRQLKKPEMNQTETQEFINEQIRKAEGALR